LYTPKTAKSKRLPGFFKDKPEGQRRILMQLELFDYQSHSEADLQWIPITGCHQHPLNPRLSVNDEQVERIAEQINLHGYKPEHAIIVRPIDGNFQIVSGHHRVEACKKVGLDTIIAWVHADMTDEQAHSLLLLENDQTELTALEKGKHAFDHVELCTGGRDAEGGLREYCRKHGLTLNSVKEWRKAYIVINCTDSVQFKDLKHSILYEISKSPEHSWRPLCQHALDEGWTVEQTKTIVTSLKEINTGDGFGYDLPDIYSRAVNNNGRLINQYKSLFDRINHWTSTLDETVALYEWVKTGETRQDGHQVLHQWVAEPSDYSPKSEFTDKVTDNHPLKAATIDEYANTILLHIKSRLEGGERWVPQLSDDEIAKLNAIDRENEVQRLLGQYIRHGDCFDILPELPKKSFDALITDPPYGVNADDWDNIDNIIEFTTNWVKLCLPLLKDEYHALIFCSSKLSADIEVALRDIITVPLQSRIIWHRRNMSKGKVVSSAFINSYDVILHYSNKPLLLEDEWSEDRFDVMTFAVPQSNFSDKKEHVTQKPIDLLMQLAKHCVGAGDKVLDPFAGVGTTGVAVLKCGGIPLLIEKETRYVDICRRRIQEVLNA
jgi:DNA modification methylase